MRLIVHGGAGVGKSATINAISKHAERILRRQGTSHNHPRIILCAFTARAANLIGGVTVHSAFGFQFGNSNVPLSDKKLAEMREAFQNLGWIIIDEVSLIGSDLLYKIHMRLHQVYQTKSGGVS